MPGSTPPFLRVAARPSRADTPPVRRPSPVDAAARIVRPARRLQPRAPVHRLSLLGFLARASARSTERGCTATPKRSSMAWARSRERRDGSASAACLANSTTSSVSLWARRGPGRAGTRAGQARAVEGGRSLIERRAGEPERRRRGAHGVALDAHPAHHLVLHLHQIAGVEKLRGGEARVGHRLRVRVQAALGTQRLRLRVPLLGPCHARPPERITLL